MSRGRTIVVALLAFLGCLGLLPATGTAATHRPVLVVAVPGLSWADVAAMPSLSARFGTSAYAELSDKTATSATRCVAGLTAFSAGERTDVDRLGCDVTTPQLMRIRLHNLHTSYAARIGAFGAALRSAGYRTGAVGPGAVALVADRAGTVDTTASDVGTAFRSADAVALVVPDLYRLGQSSDPTPAAAALRSADASIATAIDAAPTDALIAITGISDNVTGRAHLRALLVLRSSWGHTALTSVGRPPVLLLTDLGPALLNELGVPVSSGTNARATDSTLPSIGTMVDDDRRAVAALRVGGLTRLVLWSATLLLALLLLVGRVRPLVTGLALLLCFAPVSTYLAELVPWWRHGDGWYAAGVAAFAVVLSVAAALASWRWRRPVTPVAVAAVGVFLILVADQLAGAPLQFSAPLGDNPLVAGRFHGMGNIDFALMEVAALLLSAVAARWLIDRGRRTWAIAVVAVVAAVAIVVDAAPMLGDDFGGLLALLPTWGYLLLAVARVRPSIPRLAALTGAAAAVVVAVALLDYARPESAQTHIGRFVGSLLHGDAGGVLHRKANAAIGSLHDIPALVVCLVGVVAVVLAVRRRSVVGVVPQAALVALLALGVLGSALNDSGIAVGAFVVTAALPPLVLAALAPGSAQPVGDGADHADRSG